MSFEILPKKTLFCVKYPAILALRAIERQIQLPSLPWICLVPRLVSVPNTDFKHLISQYIFSTCQGDWNGEVMNKLHSVKPVLGNWQSSYRRCKEDEAGLCRARIGHSHFTHSYILRKDHPPLCEHCQCILTVCHILVDCNNFARERKNIFGRRDVVVFTIHFK